MLKRALLFGMCVAVMHMSGCKADKKIYEEIEALKARVAALEKLVAPGKEEPPVQASAYVLPVENSPVLGNKDAPVDIVVFSNFECPYCARADKMLREIVQKDEELKNKVKIVFKNFPFERHPEARPAAKAALAAHAQGKFWEMSEKIFANQKELSTANYEKWAKEVGLNVDQYKKTLVEKDKEFNEAIERDIKLGAEAAKLEGTPWILVGGWLLDDISAASIKKIIAEKKL